MTLMAGPPDLPMAALHLAGLGPAHPIGCNQLDGLVPTAGQVNRPGRSVGELSEGVREGLALVLERQPLVQTAPVLDTEDRVGSHWDEEK